jgi:translation initiation factor 2B subunit (eIF-2B alpha/beta/delta family)
MASLDDEIDSLKKQIEAAMQETQRAKAKYDNYLATVKILGRIILTHTPDHSRAVG